MDYLKVTEMQRAKKDGSI